VLDAHGATSAGPATARWQVNLHHKDDTTRAFLLRATLLHLQGPCWSGRHGPSPGQQGQGAYSTRCTRADWALWNNKSHPEGRLVDLVARSTTSYDGSASAGCYAGNSRLPSCATADADRKITSNLFNARRRRRAGKAHDWGASTSAPGRTRRRPDALSGPAATGMAEA